MDAQQKYMWSTIENTMSSSRIRAAVVVLAAVLLVVTALELAAVAAMCLPAVSPRSPGSHS